MGGFGVKHDDGTGHCFSILSAEEEEDLSISRKLYLPFNKGYFVFGGSCGQLLYFHDQYGKIIIVNPTTNESIVVPPPDFEPLPHEIELITSGLGYDAKSGEYKVVRYYVLSYLDKPDEDGEKRYCGCKDFFELYGFNSFGSWKQLKRPSYYDTVYSGIGVYVGETGSCYWVGLDTPEDYPERLSTSKQLLQWGTVFDGSVDSPLMHVLSFDFATERFGKFPLPATAMGHNVMYKLVRYYGSLGALVYDTHCATNRMPVELHVWKGKGRSWRRVYDVVYIKDAEVPVGLKDDHLFLEEKASGGRSRLMVYDFVTKQLKKLDIYNYDQPRRMSGVSYGCESTDSPLPDSIPKADYDFSRKMRADTKGKKKKSKKGKKSRR